jgi:phosphatidylglycerol:prolipoprotein diacylglycerol transferase
MFPRISDLLNYLLGIKINIPIQSYGLMMALAFLSGAIVLYFELKRKEAAGQIPVQKKEVLKGAPASISELLFSALLGFLLGWKLVGLILDYTTFSNDPQTFILSGKGSLISGLILSAALGYLTYYQKKKKALNPPVTEEITIHPYQLTGNIVLVAAIFGIIGSKIFDLFENIDALIRDPLGSIFSFSGLTFYGGLIIAAFAVVYYAHKNKITFPNISDAIAPSLILAYGIGRVGCQLAGDGCWGIVNNNPKPPWLGFLPDWVWGFNYPHNVIDEGVRLPSCLGDHCFVLVNPVYPTPLYESILCLIIFFILWIIRKHLSIPGYLFSTYLILNGIERFFIEKIRINTIHEIIGIRLTQAEIIAIVLILLGFLGFFYFYKTNPEKPTIKIPRLKK